MTSPTSGAGTGSADLNAQPDAALRALNAQSVPPCPREEVYCTKVGALHPGEMYIVGAHMDGRGLGEAADDDGSGTALVMELARIFSTAGDHLYRADLPKGAIDGKPAKVEFSLDKVWSSETGDNRRLGLIIAFYSRSLSMKFAHQPIRFS